MRTLRVGGSVGILLGLSAAFTWASTAGAQPPPAPPAPPPASSGPAMPPDYVPASTAPIPVPTELMQVSPSGLTSEQVGPRAAQTSYSAKAAQENLRGAAARVDAAWAQFLPRLTGTARYTRLSGYTVPSAGTIVATNAPPGPINPLALPPMTGFQAVALAFPIVLDNWLLQANITVPISDYFLRINQNYTAAGHSADAYRFDMIVQRATAASNGKIAYYTWLQARGAIIVAVQTLNDQRTHLKDAQNQFTVGNASRADVLRAETQVASAELALERARNLADLSEKQLRIAMHASDSEVFVPGENLDSPLPPFVGNVKQLTLEAIASRYELRSIEANVASARETVNATKAGYYPQVSAFADAIEGNPNPRRFPATQDWFGTWDVGAQIIWSPNDTYTTKSQLADAESRVSALEAQRGVTRDGIEVEVVQMYQAVKEADFSIETSKRELASAIEAARVARELFNNGRATATTLTDAETDLTRARLDLLNAQVAARTARVRLDHALGRDLRPFVTP